MIRCIRMLGRRNCTRKAPKSIGKRSTNITETRLVSTRRRRVRKKTRETITRIESSDDGRKNRWKGLRCQIQPSSWNHSLQRDFQSGDCANQIIRKITADGTVTTLPSVPLGSPTITIRYKIEWAPSLHSLFPPSSKKQVMTI